MATPEAMNKTEYEAMYQLEDHLWWYVGMRRITERVLNGRLVPSPAERRVLDAGCGTGGNLTWLAGFGSAYGVDLSPLAMGLCRRRGLSTVAQGSVTRLPFAEGTFDLVTSFDVVYHLDVEDDVAALREMRRVLRPGGTIFVRVPALDQLRSGHDAAVHTRQRYTARELRAKATRAGFTIERASYANSALLPLAAAARLAKRWSTDWRAGSPMPEATSDVRPVPGVVNALFTGVLGLEAAVLAHLDLPLGLSAFVVARRPMAPVINGEQAR
ncbi:MAG: class I SAM-dependent methyltransferase [Chloroflexota bacterium]|nr:class I SAM-dependent methyltransferase [Chloroflexota bacterium]